MGWISLTVAVLSLLTLAGIARAEEPKPPTPEEAANQVLRATEIADDSALRALAEKNTPDPWLVADELCRRGRHEAALSCAKAALRPALAGLPAYVESRRAGSAEAESRRLLARLRTAVQEGRPAEAVEFERPESGETASAVLGV